MANHKSIRSRRTRRLLAEPLEQRLALTAEISGIAFNDLNSDGVFKPVDGESPAVGRAIFLDLNANGRFDAQAEPSQITDSDGKYSFKTLLPGSYSVAQVETTNFTQTYPLQLPSVIRQIDLKANDIIYEPVGKKLYASVGSGGSAYADSIVEIDPIAGTVGRSVHVGINPGKLAVSDNGQYLYVGLDGDFAVRRVALSTLTAEVQFSLGPRKAEDIEVLPGDPHAVAVARIQGTGNPNQEGIAIYDDGIERSDVAGYLDAIEFGPDSSTLFAFDNRDTNFNFSRLSVTPNGVVSVEETRGLARGFGTDIEYEAGRIYTTTGRIFDPVSNLPIGLVAATGSVEPVASRGLVFYLDGAQLRAFDQQTFLPAGSLAISGVTDSAPGLVHWGSDGLAFRTTTGQVVLVEWEPRTATHHIDLSIDEGIENLDFGIRSNVEQGSISGKIFFDANAGGSRDAGEPGIAGWTVFIDGNSNGTLDAGEQSTVTDHSGSYTFTGLLPGTYRIAQVPKLGWDQTSPIVQSTARIRQLNLQVNDLVFDATNGKIYGSVPSAAGGLGNSVATIDPVSGKAVSSFSVESEPNKLSLSDDGQFLYVSSDGAYAVQRFDLGTFQPNLRFSLFPLLVDAMEVGPGNPDVLALTPYDPQLSPKSDVVAIYDNGVKRPLTTDPGHPTLYNPRKIAFSDDGNVLYAYNNVYWPFEFDKLTVSDDGVSLTKSTIGLLTGFNVDIKYDNGLIFATTGEVIDPEAATLLGKFPASGSVAPDSSRGLAFFLNGTTLYAFDQQSFSLVGTLKLSGISSTSSSLIRWGTNGLAFKTNDGHIVLVEWDPRTAAKNREYSAVVASGQTVSNLDFGNHNLVPSDSPDVANDAFETKEDSPLVIEGPGVLSNDKDQAGEMLSATVVSGPAHGTLSLSDSGGFTYSPASNYNGPDSFTYNAFNGQAVSLATVSLTITPVNDAPSFTKGTDRTATDISGPRTISGWAKAIAPGPADEKPQAIHFEVNSSNPNLFAKQPAFDSTGTLTFEPKVNASGSAQVSIILVDDAGTGGGGVDRSAAQTFVITVTLTFPWYNQKAPTDVSGDGLVVAGDVMDVINFINAFGAGPVIKDGRPRPEYYDVTRDNYVSADDVIAVINHINAQPASTEQESSVSNSEASGIDSVLLQLIASDSAAQLNRRRRL